MLLSITAVVVVLESDDWRRFNARIYSWFGLRARGRELLWKRRVVETAGRKNL
jgi:hypothetical protein